MDTISQIRAREVLDSRGNPTLEVDVLLSNGAFGSGLVPSGASTGAYEAVELRDSDCGRFLGRGVLNAIENINLKVAPELIGREVRDLQTLDSILIGLDGTCNKSNLGANTILGVSMAMAYAMARSRNKPLYAYLCQECDFVLPVPMLNIINGGRHADNSIDIQEFMVVPAGFDSFRESLRAGVEIYHCLKNLLHEKNLSTSVGDEGGFAPLLNSNRDALEYILKAIEGAGYIPGEQCFIALDVAATELFVPQDGNYSLLGEGLTLTPERLIKTYESWINEYPIVSIEDGISEEDWANWRIMTNRLGDRIQLVGDDLLVTNVARIRKAIELNASNAVLIKLNQIGTVTETLQAINLAKGSGLGVVVSHRSGETEDTIIADCAVGTAAGQIKTGAPARGERTAKYNRMLRIEEELSHGVKFAGRSIYERFTS